MVTGGGFCFLSGVLGLNDDGQLVGRWSELPAEGRALGSGFAQVDALEGAPGAQAWAAFARARSLLRDRGADFGDMLQLHLYQKDKRFFPVFERIRQRYEPDAPAPASGIGVGIGGGGRSAWFALDGIAVDPVEWRFGERRRVLRHVGEQAPGSHYSQAVLAGPYVFLAGQLPLDHSRHGTPMVQGYDDVPEEGRFLRVGRSHPDFRDGPIAAQTWFTYAKIARILDAAGCGPEDVVAVTVFLQDMRDYATFHRVHERSLARACPALTVVEVGEVGHKGTRVEVEVTAMRRTEGLAHRAVAPRRVVPGAHCAPGRLAGPLLFISGQLGVTASGDAVAQLPDLPPAIRSHAAAVARMTGRSAATAQAFAIFERIGAILGDVGRTWSAVARLILYVEDERDLIPFDLTCRHYCPDRRPAFSCVTVGRAGPVPGARLCLEAIAVLD
jgi:2-iminobutanoate/2-iminopropanoate deaminase